MSAAFLRFYEPSGRPKSNPYAAAFRTRFGASFVDGERVTSPPAVDAAAAARHARIFAELVRAANVHGRDRETLLFLDAARGAGLAACRTPRECHERYRSYGEVPRGGALTIAVAGYQLESGYSSKVEDAPCAEFPSEMIREAYARVPGQDFRSDFGPRNRLSAGVTILTHALVRAGWVAWNPRYYKPPTGALLLHAEGVSGATHAYIAGEDGGRIVVDNGRGDRGRDLSCAEEQSATRGGFYCTTARTLGRQYVAGAFLLPPGQVPTRW